MNHTTPAPNLLKGLLPPAEGTHGLHFVGTPKPLKGLRMPSVCALTGLSKSTIYAKLNPRSPSFDPTFPGRVHLNTSGKGAVIWIEWEVQEWVRSRAALRQSV